MRMHKMVRPLIAAVAAFVVVVAVPAQAASPGSGTLSKAGQKLKWTGSFQATTLEARCDVVDVCDHFKLKVNMGEGARIRVQLPAPNPATDLDVYVYDPKGVEIAESGNLPSEDESLTFTHKAKYRNKVYDITVVPYFVVPGAVTYEATASVTKYVK
jgi:hypothetical protein